MQSVFALAGVVGFAAAAVAPAYGASSQQEAATVPAYGASSEQDAATIPAYGASSEQDAATIPAYGASSEEASATAPSYEAQSTEAAATIPVYTNKTVKTSEAAATIPVYHTSYEYATVTISTSAYVTYCPKPTQPTTLVFNTKTYTVTDATTLTVTACESGCTVTKTVPIVKTTEEAATVPVAYTSAPAVTTEEAATVPVPYTSVENSPVTTEEAATVYPTLSTISIQNQTAVYPSAPAQYTGAATRVGAGAFAMVAGLAALL